MSSLRTGYRAIVDQIKYLRWGALDADGLRQLMYLSYIAALEFAEALRIAGGLYAENSNVSSLMAGELETSNLVFEDYSAQGDHSAFLLHFLQKEAIEPIDAVLEAGDVYLAYCRALSAEVRAMSVFSREEELSGIFEQILTAPDWSGTSLSAYRYFLERHIRLDSDDGGHHDLTKEFPVDDRLTGFYEVRLGMYRSLLKLFGS